MKYAGGGLGPNWPKTVAAFSRELRRIAPQLRVHGISITFERKSEERVITVRSERTRKDGSRGRQVKPTRGGGRSECADYSSVMPQVHI